jgi:cyclic-di-GMP-binding protein
LSASPPGSKDGLAFHEAHGCKEWLNALALTNIPQAQILLLEGLRTLNASGIEPVERLKCLELMRDKVAFLQGEQRSRYFGKSLPLSANDNGAWMTGSALLEAMESGYREVLAAAGGDAEARRHAPLVAQRVIRYIGAQMLFHAIVYRRVDPELWKRLHGQYREAEAAGWGRERVKDSLEADESGLSVEEAYAHVVMLHAAYLSELRAHEIDFTEALLRQWIRKVHLGPEAPAGSTHALAVDLERDIGARPLAQVEAGAGRRVFDTSAVSKSLRKRQKGLKDEEPAAALGMPHAPSEVDLAHMLHRLHRLWCDGAPPRPPARTPEEKTAGVVFGLGEIHFFVTGGKSFEQPDRKRELTSREKQDIEVFGRVTERTHSMMVGAEQSFTVEPWAVIDEMRGAWRLQRPSTASRGVSIGRIVAMRVGDTAPFYLGMLSALVQETDGRIIVTVTLFPGKPEPVAVRPADARNRATAKWSEAFRLPAMDKLHVPGSLVLPSGMAHRGRGVELWEGEPKESTVYEVLEHGADFDRITVF